MSTNFNLQSKPFAIEGCRNPKKFLETVKNYFECNSVSGNEQLDFVDIMLKGNQKIWFDTYKNSFFDFDDFQFKFLKEFYSISMKMQYRNQWFNSRFDPSDDSLQTYFLRQAEEAKYLEPKMEPYEIHFFVLQQLPSVIFEKLTLIDFSNFEGIFLALSQLDLVYYGENFDYFEKGADQVDEDRDLYCNGVDKNLQVEYDLNCRDVHIDEYNPEKLIDRDVFESDSVSGTGNEQKIGNNKIDSSKRTLVNGCNMTDDVYLSRIQTENTKKAYSVFPSKLFCEDDLFVNEVNNNSYNLENKSDKLKNDIKTYVISWVYEKFLALLLCFLKCFILSRISLKTVNVLNSDLQKRKPPDKCMFVFRGVLFSDLFIC